MSVETLTRSILAKMSQVGKWQREFFVELVLVWLGLRGRYTFENLRRQGVLSAVSYRSWFRKDFDFKQFNHLLISEYTSQERIWAFDASFISKAGKHTPGLGYFWSGCAQAVKRGPEITGLAVVDALNHTALHYHAAQTLPKQGQSLLDYYAGLLTSQATQLLKLSPYIAADAYFAKYSFVESITQAGLHVITRLRDDAVLLYPYLGPKREGRGRQKKYQGKVDVQNLDFAHFRPCFADTDSKAFEACLYVKAFKRLVKVLVLHHYHKEGSIKSSKIFVSTDTALSGADVWLYYHLRYQIEFLYRDGKQFTGLTHCQSRQKERLCFQFNFSLTLISLVKVVHWLSQPLTQRSAFSMHDVKTHYANQQLLERFFQAFGLCPHTAKNNPAYQQLLDYAKIAA